jgi:type VI secretion system secreted protein Hcp
MPTVIPEMMVHSKGGGSADMYLSVQTRRAGKVKGESTSPGHEEEIIVHSWNWGLTASSAIGSTQATGRRSYTHLTVNKNIDSATTALMSALAQNDMVKEAKLSMRKSGDGQDDYFIITLKDARITGVHHNVVADGSTMETVAIAFTKVEVEYKPQKGTGLRSGSTTFTDELVNNT